MRVLQVPITYDGEETGRAANATVTYVVDIDSNYGADADGRRGVQKIEYHLLDVAIEAEDLMAMTSAEVEQVIADVPRVFMRSLKQYH
jgi:hypothetical protein